MGRRSRGRRGKAIRRPGRVPGRVQGWVRGGVRAARFRRGPAAVAGPAGQGGCLPPSGACRAIHPPSIFGARKRRGVGPQRAGRPAPGAAGVRARGGRESAQVTTNCPSGRSARTGRQDRTMRCARPAAGVFGQAEPWAGEPGGLPGDPGAGQHPGGLDAVGPDAQPPRARRCCRGHPAADPRGAPAEFWTVGRQAARGWAHDDAAHHSLLHHPLLTDVTRAASSHAAS
jgi:hypothetical protein